MNTLDLKAAADFLGIHPSTLQERALAGDVPGAKIGKEWRFLDVDLVAYFRGHYPANQEPQPCPSTAGARRGGSRSRTTDSELDDLLARPTGRKRSGCTTKLKLVSGPNNDPAPR